MHTLKQDNHHKAHPTECETCGRKLPKRAYRRQCATCIKTPRCPRCGDPLTDECDPNFCEGCFQDFPMGGAA